MKKVETGFIVLMAFLMSLVALAIDAMMPALDSIRESLDIATANDAQLIISTVFLGMAAGLMIYGPLSDAYGRKKALYLGLGIFIFGSILSVITNDFNMMLLGRILQGFGAASCRVVSTAMIRDKFEGPEMGKVMSLIMVIFIIVPALAPSIGQGILLVATWEYIFYLFIVLGILITLVLRFKQEETLKRENRIELSYASFKSGALETLMHKESRGYTIAAGLIFGAFVGYLSTAQQILQVQFGLGKAFSIYFGILALFIGASSFLNAKLVDRFGMIKLSMFSLMAMCLFSILYLIFLFTTSNYESFFAFIIYLGSSFLFIGFLFGNLNTLAIQPLGHIAGTANSVISSVQTFISVIIGGGIGQLYNGTVVPLVIGFFILSILSMLTIIYCRRA